MRLVIDGAQMSQSYFKRQAEQLEKARDLLRLIVESKPFGDPVHDDWVTDEQRRSERELVEAYINLFVPLSNCQLTNPKAFFVQNQMIPYLDKTRKQLIQVTAGAAEIANSGNSSIYDAVIADINTQFNTESLRTYLLYAQMEEITGASVEEYLGELREKFSSFTNTQTEFSERSEKADEWFKNSQQSFDTLHGAMNKSQIDFDTYFQKALIRKESTIFQKEAQVQKTAASWWLAAGGVVLAMLIYYVLVVVTDPAKSEKMSVILPLLVSKLAVVTLGSISLNIIMKNYSACRHNMTVNRHREHALSTFEFFVNAAAHDPETKNAVLLEVTKVIFSPANSGYLKGAQDSNSGGMNILEIIKHVPKTEH